MIFLFIHHGFVFTIMSDIKTRIERIVKDPLSQIKDRVKLGGLFRTFCLDRMFKTNNLEGLVSQSVIKFQQSL